MNIRKTIITAIVGLTLVATIVPVSTVNALTIEELQAQINLLMAQLSQLQGSTPSASSGVPAVCTGVTFTRNMTTGATGSDVKCLQAVLNQSASTQVSTTGAGSPGNETSYFGGLTLAAVKIFQAQNGMTPANQVGPMTRARLNQILAGSIIDPGLPPVVQPSGAGLTVALASDNPAGTTIVDGQALAKLAKVTFTNGDSSEVKVTGLKLKRIGISADASIANLYLFDGATRLTDGSAVSSTMVNFNNTSGLFTVPAFSSRTITLFADISAANAAAGETIGLQVVTSTDITSNASSIKGFFPVTGNLMTVATGTLAGVEFNATTTPAAATIDPQNDYTVWQNSVVVTTRAVDMSRISFRKTGSVKDADLQNFRLYVDGVQVGATVPNIVLNSNNESLVTFDLTSSPKRLEAGTRVVKVLADIIGGSSLTFTFNLWNVADVTVSDTQYGANITSDLISDAAFSKRSTGEQTIGTGTLTITKMTESPSGNIVNLASNATLAKFQLKAAGERVKIETLYISANVNTATVSGLRNGAIYANGVQIGSTTTLYDPADSSYDYTTFNLGSSLIVEPGSPVTLEVRADVYDTGTSDTTNNITTTGTASTIQITIEGSSSWNNATGLSSSSTIDAPGSDVSGNTLTVAAGGLTLSKYTAYTDQSMVPPLTAAKIGHFTLTANTTEAVNITSIEANLDNVTSTYASNLYVKFGTNTTSTKASVTTASNSWSVNYALTAGQTVDVLVYADLNSSATGIGDVSVYVAGTTASSATAVTAGTSGSYTTGTSGVQGQAITYTSGTFTPAVDGNTPVAQIVAGGQLVVAGKFKFTGLYDAYTVKELRFTVGDGTTGSTSPGISAAIDSAVLKDGDTVLATVPYDGANNYFNFTGLSVAVPTNSSTGKVLTLAFNLSSSISSSTSTSQVDIEPALNYIKYANSQGSETTSDMTTDVTTYDTNKEMYVFKSIPTVTEIDVTNSVISNNAAKNVYSVKVAADAKGSVAVKQMKFALTWDDSTTDNSLYLYAFKLFKDGDDITSLVTITDEDGNSLETSTAALGANENSAHAIVTFDTEDTISAGTSSTYILQATPSGFAAADSDEGADGFSVKLASDTSVNASTKKYLNGSASPATGVVQLATSAGASGVDANFIWSDNSALSHASTVSANTATATSSGDWSNGYLVKNISSFAGEAFSR
ncbi:MAG: hypothetical protein A2312_04735 [Candidatus Staskawiczbacteria bacterium RIFOXYB2_FULL_32_9]|uniref:Peptidoglycan binding-like domain-containing protein n=1 Tax=Candidatus Staskawiczbacteria bacterium RIFOXYD1_FULL_32_13 TaxID=1802234 RepID=A0A1G2JQ96_9BACT|nr:MAG: hypothetical protein UR22_C0012G0039 [Parcubacteria group bacterium GW2011_GWC2_32_10]OGZ81239.1 MAG: hypothetical protein A2312_04735 [Candidatus Staskawiczbacteria bacterium RIFOXYB2_FULL_32_9]OGZ85030.1 MAG: hypothetical protein A2463_04605 [Candidatus Staskawiczbacteria bacterium RIFOXYC2_FULL_32_10]OGZ89305.1 MAG: hypothetical protein A2561_02645 [Candidatus Staskawiczbacteria bacterium RIFOXYD1_FULL_32_13]